MGSEGIKFVIYIMDSHCDYSVWPPLNLATSMVLDMSFCVSQNLTDYFIHFKFVYFARDDNF